MNKEKFVTDFKNTVLYRVNYFSNDKVTIILKDTSTIRCNRFDFDEWDLGLIYLYLDNVGIGTTRLENVEKIL
jgi:hypothetical protein